MPQSYPGINNESKKHLKTWKFERGVWSYMRLAILDSPILGL